MTASVVKPSPLEYYAFETRVDNDGQPVLAGAEHAGDCPSTVAALNLLATPKGSLPYAREVGLDFARFTTIYPGREADVEDAVRDALQPLLALRAIERVNVSARVYSRGSVGAVVDFYDTQLRDRVRIDWRS